jgi:hypothetical protein
MPSEYACMSRISDSAWTRRTHGISSRPDEGSAQADSWRTGFTLHVESKAGRRNPDPTATDQCASPAGTETTAPQQYRSFSVCLALSLVPLRPWRHCDCQAGDHHSLAPRSYWRWRSRNRVGRPRVSAELRTLIHEMSRANPLWGAPHIHGELLKLGFEVAQSTVARYMLSFPKIISARTDDAARTEWAWRQWSRIAGSLAVAAHLCPATNAYASHCNRKNTRSGSDADGKAMAS